MKQFVSKIILVILSGVLLSAPISTDGAAFGRHQKPNVLIITADNLGYGDLSIMGAKDIQTPTIDEFFTDGLMFTEFYANAPTSSPTQASLLSGRFPALVGVPGTIRRDSQNNWGYFQCEKTMAHHFREAGYLTALIGKWNLGFEAPNLPNAQGFDLFMGFLGDEIDDYYTHRHENVNCMRFNESEIDAPGHTTDLFSNWSASFILREAESDKPFFLYLSYNAPGPLLQPDEDHLKDVSNRNPTLSPERAKHIALIEQMDRGIGRVMQALKETNQLKNTIIIFTSTNGGIVESGASNGRLRGGKLDLFEGGIRVPTSIYWKKGIKKGSLSHQMSMTMDLFPTLCSLAQVPTNQILDGQDLTTCILDNVPLQQERTLFWTCREGGEHHGEACYAARQGAYKLMQNRPSEKFRLYNLTTDPHEVIPLAESSEHYRRLHRALMDHVQENEKIPWFENAKKQEHPSSDNSSTSDN
ncbi:sulfatase-like hydrolase/transferase [Sunxiuqinia dokdonensis]|nr:sulfatase-like hydrolase/transferase [Sunxiuqinia dokdonensis]